MGKLPNDSFAVIESEFDLGRRALMGTIAYYFTLGASVALTSLESDHPAWCWPLVTAMALTSAFRIWIIVRQARFYRERRALWNRLFNGTSILVASLWGLFSALHIYFYGVTVTTSFVLLTVCGSAAGAATSFHPRLWLVRVYLVLFMLPSVATIPWGANRETHWIASLVVLFCAYLWIQAGKFHKDYWESVINREDARNERDKHKESDERFQYVLEAGKVGVWERDLKGGTVYYSETLSRLWGLDPRSEPQREAFVNSVHPEDRSRFEQELIALNGQKTSWKGDFRLLLNGETRWVSVNAHRLHDAEGDFSRIVGIAVDITERRQTDALLETQRMSMISSSKMASLGEMAAGIAHEINNPLAIISMNAGIIQSCLKQDPINREQILDRTEKMTATIKRIANIIRGLRAFSRSTEHDPPELVSVETLVEDTLSLTGERMKAHQITLRVSPVPKGMSLECRATEVSQVLLNLLNNAFDAVDGQTEKWIELVISDLGDKIEFSVTDSGPGVPAENREKIIQPFFTTKPVGKGTGLGLSISKGVADSHQGRLYLAVQEKPTRFVLELPKRQPALAAQKAA